MRMLSSVFWPLPCLPVLGDNDACTYMSSGSLFSSCALPHNNCVAPCWVCGLHALQPVCRRRVCLLVDCRPPFCCGRACLCMGGSVAASRLIRCGWLDGRVARAFLRSDRCRPGWECKYCNLTHICLACWAAVQVVTVGSAGQALLADSRAIVAGLRAVAWCVCVCVCVRPCNLFAWSSGGSA